MSKFKTVCLVFKAWFREEIVPVDVFIAMQGYDMSLPYLQYVFENNETPKTLLEKGLI